MSALNRVERGRYLDSVALMRVSRRLAALPGVENAALMIGTPANKALLRDAGLLAAEGDTAGPNDLIVAVRGAEAAAALAQVPALLDEKQPRSEGLRRVRSFAAAAQLEPGANLALISVPGEYAAQEARKALAAGLDVMIFSDNVPIEEELALKRLAAERGRLVMGPDCGTALIGGTPIAFANAVPRGDIGLVSASGTGLQEVSTLIARMGGGVSHGIGVGGRDLDERVGGLATLAALDALAGDPGTRRIVLISKPPSPAVARKVLERAKQAGKPFVACFLGSNEPGVARTLTDAAERATERKLPLEKLSLERRPSALRGLFCGGTLCAEAELIAGKRAGDAFLDLGDDEHTRGRPHPMIEPELRNAHIAAAVNDSAVGVLLVDVVLGFGAHENPAGVLAANDFKGRTVIASVTGTEHDPQGWSRQAAILRAAGIVVAPSNARAAELAASVSR